MKKKEKIAQTEGKERRLTNKRKENHYINSRILYTVSYVIFVKLRYFIEGIVASDAMAIRRDACIIWRLIVIEDRDNLKSIKRFNLSTKYRYKLPL